MNLHPGTKTTNPQLRGITPGFFSIGLVIPFQPSMADKKIVRGLLNYSLEIVQMKLESKCTADETRTIIERLEKVFEKLNYDSHRKSVAIIINGDNEKIIYLNYNSKPVFFFNDPFSLLDLVADSASNPEFELLIMSENKAELYEYFNESVHKAFAHTQQSSGNKKNISNNFFQKVSNILKLVNKKNEKPVFIFSEDPTANEQILRILSFQGNSV